MKERSTSKLLKRVISGICVFAMIFSMGVLQAFSVSAEVGDPQNAEPCTHKSVFDFDYTDFRPLSTSTDVGYRTQADEDSDKDRVIVVDTAKITNTGERNNFLTSLKIGAQLPGGSTTYLLNLKPEDVKQDGKYHLYKGTHTLREGNYNNLYLSDYVWPRSETIFDELTAAGLVGKKLDFYFSIKVESNMTGDDPENQSVDYVYYIERIFVVDPEAATYVVNDDATCTKQGTISITCNTCGLVITNHNGTVVPHSFVGNKASDVLVSGATCTEAATYKAQCDNCDFVHESLTATVGKANGHSFTTYVDNGNGTESAICDDCGTSHTRSLRMDLTAMQIALPDNATAVETSAVNELVLYIKKITGKTVSVVSESEVSGAAIYVGATKFAKNNNVTFPDDEFGEGWAIKVINDDVVLTGGKTRGTLYAVYHLLEDVLGVRWWNLWEEYVPTADFAEIPEDYDDSGVPAIEYRDIYIGATISDPMYYIRNRLNCWSGSQMIEYGGREYWGPPNDCHTNILSG